MLPQEQLYVHVTLYKVFLNYWARNKYDSKQISHIQGSGSCSDPNAFYLLRNMFLKFNFNIIQGSRQINTTKYREFPRLPRLWLEDLRIMVPLDVVAYGKLRWTNKTSTGRERTTLTPLSPQDKMDLVPFHPKGKTALSLLFIPAIDLTIGYSCILRVQRCACCSKQELIPLKLISSTTVYLETVRLTCVRINQRLGSVHWREHIVSHSRNTAACTGQVLYVTVWTGKDRSGYEWRRSNRIQIMRAMVSTRISFNNNGRTIGPFDRDDGILKGRIYRFTRFVGRVEACGSATMLMK